MQRLVAAWLEIDLSADEAVAELGAARPHDVVAGFGPRFLKQEVHVESIVAPEAFEVALVELLRKHEHGRAGLLDLDLELGVQVARDPGHVDAGPLLHEGPLVVEEACAVQDVELAA